ncbi:hypothetical protein NSK_003439 [Nannochloropsis salina CCMP1776]|uniref:Chaperone DnaJ C-terminal domain-containing protein n=1 Tax=Nannochloropsis salina CCMP1776 TaxID=1027361 RepID=A0A4D9D6D3_9STRA|nr:hypothetical protein NSK_003439 [Nannochloropsis salina CCMP1776]|eukprot:TFJ85015.1 hypothetical protein NSK_003439 [Nannochloropsis salina CCMP1776]
MTWEGDAAGRGSGFAGWAGWAGWVECLLAWAPGGFGGPGASPTRSSGPPKKAEPLEYNFNVTLEDLYTGGKQKKMRITKKIWDAASGKFLHTTVDKEIPIKKGWKNGTKITFEREGDELPGVIPADIVFILNTKPHPRFEREGDDLVYAATVTLEQALTGVEVSVQTLDGRVLKVSEPHVTPGTVKILRGEGMPLQKTPEKKGNLRVKFNIVFPTLSETQKQEIKRVLRGGRM